MIMPSLKSVGPNATLVQGDEFRADTFFSLQGGPKRGEIWVVTNPHPNDGNGPVLVKRVIGLPGEKVATDGGVVTIDGRMVERMHAEMARRTVAIAESIGQ